MNAVNMAPEFSIPEFSTASRWAVCALAALSIQAGVAFALLYQADEDASGNAVAAGEFGVSVGFGQEGANEQLLKHLNPPTPVKPEPKEKPPEKPKPIVKAKPVPIKEPVKKPIEQPTPAPVPVKAEPKPVAGPTFAVAEKKSEPIEQQEPEPEAPAEIETDNTQPVDNEAKAQPESDVAAVKRTGRANHESTGGKFGTSRDYLAFVMAALMEHHTYPAKARKEKEEGTVKVKFVFDREGYILSREVIDSSGSPTLDQAALAMLDAASPLPPVPPEYFKTRNTLLLTAPVEYSLRD